MMTKEYEFTDVMFRPISKQVTNLIKDWNITANQISVFSFLVIIIACLLMHAYINISGLLILFFIILDNVDGEIARLKNQTSKLGHWLDAVIGFISVEILIITMIFITGNMLGIFTLIAFPMQYLLIYFYKAEIVSSNKPIKLKGILNKLKLLYGSNLFFMLASIGCLFNKLGYVLMFFAIFGNLFWMGTLMIQTKSLTKGDRMK